MVIAKAIIGILISLQCSYFHCHYHYHYYHH
jgi:hypothetical protein